MQFQNYKDKVLIIDFGSQVTKLIARRIRDFGVYSEIINPKELIKLKKFHDIKGIILSGGPSTVTVNRFQSVPKNIFEKKIPILGICYGLQLIAKIFGGKIKSSKKKREFGRAILFKKFLVKRELFFLYKIALPNSLFFFEDLIFPPNILAINCKP